MSEEISAGDQIEERERNEVFGWLKEHNVSLNRTFMEAWELPENAPVPLYVLAKEGDRVLGGLTGETEFAWLKIHILAVDPSRRNQGIATRLVEAAEALARERSCRYAYVDSMSYQAPGFFIRRGYQQVGVLPDWDSHGHDKCLFRKELA